MNDPEKKEEQWWYLSFCDGKRSKGSQFVGACIVRGDTLAEANSRTQLLGINPGGECLGVPLGSGERTIEDVPKEFRDRLLDRPTLAQLDAIMGVSNSDASVIVTDERAEAIVANGGGFICETHNVKSS